ncbi:MAG: MlaD family protein [Bacteroidales bacterium]|nr:MlaD family protein [Bacteroidales bacterium]
MKNFSKETMIGIVTLISFGLLYFGLNYLKGINLFKPTNYYYVQLKDVASIEVSSPIYIEGFRIGLVREIDYNYDDFNADIFVKVELDKKMRLPKDSYAELVESFLSGGSLHLQLNKFTDDYLSPGDTIQGVRKTDMMQQIDQKILPDVVALLPKIDSILTGLNVLVNHPALNSSLSHIEKTASNLEKSTIQLNRMMSKDVPQILANINTITENIEVTTNQLKEINLVATIDTINGTLSNLKMLTYKFNQKDNTIGLLLNDKSLYENLDSTVSNANKLLIDLKQNPKRYVHFSVF